ncbi:ABC transporter ATP-binding protein [Promicromonospora sp. AC04]|uniref:ABC transporter ATP-binding protein n=1 Tax=Promicromonospora sp. AC04 TaxID=2135723 RepID=UPI000D366A43
MPDAGPDTSPLPEAPAAVEVRGATREFPADAGSTSALAGVDLAVGEGELVSLIGPSGCGKSTLLRLIADLDTPTSGTVAVFGKTPAQARADQDYGIVFQEAGLLPWRSVQANVELPMQLHGEPAVTRRTRAQSLLALVGLADFAGHRPHQLSGGMQQRVAIARALARSPRLLLMDEPFGALDELTRERMQTELLNLRAATGAAVVFVTHSIQEAVYLSDRVVVLSPRPGRVVDTVEVALGDPAERAQSGGALRGDRAFFELTSAVREALHASGRATATT